VIDQDLLGSDLVALLAELPSPVVQVKPITGLAARSLHRATFRIRLADGTVLKGRRLDAAADAQRVYELARLLDADAFPRPVAIRGAALLEPWIDGRVVRDDEEPQLLRRCGALLGSVHAIEHDLDGEARRWTPEHRLAEALARLETLRLGGHLSRRRSVQLAAIAQATVPIRASTGLVHRDLWPRNVVVDRDGLPWIIDNGNVGLGAHAFDLARTEYLWPMSHGQREAFLCGYDSTAPAREPTGTFWLIDVLTEAAVFRIGAGARGVSRPLARLGEIAG